jgi:lipoprotein NlpD
MWQFRAAQFMLPAIVVVLAACASQRAVPADHLAANQQKNAVGSGKPRVSEQSVPLRQPESPTRTVVHGDTLYSIAWETGRDYRELAKWNRIRPPYTILPGQELRVIPPAAEKVTAVPAPAKPSAKNTETKKTDVKPSNSSKPGKLAVAPTPTPSVPKPASVSTDSSKTKNNIRTKTKAEPAKSQDSGKAGSGSWAWPADGQILKRYGESDSGKGLDIGGTRGQSVRATAGGRVVYQGSGLRGYGQLIIIKHSDEFLSAYAHNDRIYVKEGDVVKRGQKIADMGSTGTDRVKLHFEIRRQGIPTDPLKYLPKR